MKPTQFHEALDKLDLDGLLMLMTVLSNKAWQLSLQQKPKPTILEVPKPEIIHEF
jgi:hypothetical protein